MAPVTKIGRKRKRVELLDDEVEVNSVQDDEAADVLDGVSSSVNTSEVREAGTSKIDRSSPNSNKTAYLPYKEGEWSPLFLYRTPFDLTLTAIRQSGSEGIGRYEIGKTYGMDTTTKAGNRRVSANIVNGIKSFPDHFGQYQKMEGKIRCIKYYWKVAAHPESFIYLFKSWKAVVGDDCPFRIGEVLRFPNTNLSTLRMSDVSLRRLIDIMKVLKEHRVIVTIHHFMKIITDMEIEYGLHYQIDKKSLLKCLKALEKKGYLHMFQTVVVEEFRSNKILVITESDIAEASHPEVEAAIRVTISEYNERGRVFPHGQLRLSHKKPEKDGEKSSDFTPEDIEMLENDSLNEMTVVKRLAMFRLQMMRRLSIIFPEQQSHNAVESHSGLQSEPQDINEAEIALPQTERIGENENAISVDESSSNLASPSASATNEKLSVNTRLPNDMYGQQNKMIRCYIIHQLVWHCLYGLPQGTKPNVWERFPPYQAPGPGISVNQCPVYIDDESPYRFIPPIPPHQDLPNGWFLLQDLINVLPLSIYVLFVNMKTKVDVIESYLRDPILRHMLISDLPINIRMKLLSNKKAVLQLEHILLTLCGFGLARVGPTVDAKKVTSVELQYFYLPRSGYLRDTSTSQKGYCRVSMPIDQYTKYEYVFDTMDDVICYWHHLRAIVQSTPLSFRMETLQEDVRLYKKYTIGMFDRSQIVKPFEDLSTTVFPILPHDGCAGFDSSFFIHLRRHWDLNPRPMEFVNWFLHEWRRATEKSKSLVESRVKNYQNSWNSYFRALVPPDSGIFRRSEIEFRQIHVFLIFFYRTSNESHALVRSNPGSLGRKSCSYGSKSLKGKKKRPYDEVDIISEQRRVHLRNRFTSLERNMLILIRAVGFFLNPMYRFWLEPAVLRDIMHENVQEARSKTVQSLMAAGVREMKRAERVTYLQRIVKNLASFKEMRALRSQLAFHPISDPASKKKFFIEAFNKAKQLLFMELSVIHLRESEKLPKTSESDESFEKFMSIGKINISTEVQKTAAVPVRSQKPKDPNQIRHCVAFNVVVGALISEQDLTDKSMECIFEKLGVPAVTRVLEQLRIDGLITRQRFPIEDSKFSWKSQATLSFNFRHFFNHRFHPDMLEQLIESSKEMEHGTDFAADDDTAGTVAAVTRCFYAGPSLKITVDDDVLECFDASSQDQIVNATKQLRYLESADLHLERITVTPEGDCTSCDVPDVQQVLNSLKRTYSLEVIRNTNFDDYLMLQSIPSRSFLRRIHTAVKESKFIGMSVEELTIILKSSGSVVNLAVQQMETDSQLVTVGVDTVRYVLPTYSDCWLVPYEKLVYVPAPWFMLSGEIHAPAVRWMAEGVLFSIISRPGCPIDELKRRFAYVLQPRMLLEIVRILELCSCIRIQKLTSRTFRRKSLFENVQMETDVFYVSATKNAMEQFSRIFGAIPLPAILKSTRPEDV
uniref:DEP domain-containing protein n=1 Tax=Elaeophora elaphi TaxID=1147741 RepID=A0A158Q6Q2_9BILA